MSSIPSTSSATTAQSTDTTSNSSSKTINQGDFLKLLVAQLAAQDPMNPESNTDFIGQMAQFSTLQATQSMQQNMSSMEAGDFLGRTVNVQDSDGTISQGIVSQLQLNSGTPSIIVNGAAYTLSQVLSVQPTSSTP